VWRVEVFEQTDALLDAKINIHFKGIKQFSTRAIPRNGRPVSI
jgi:ribosome-associated toxin RatA of RatAB toxin-antitoxin module